MVVASRPISFGGKYTEKRSKRRCCLLFISFCLITCPRVTSALSDSEYEELKSERAEAAKEWAPLVYLHPKETIFPIAVHTFIKNVIPKEVKKDKTATESPVLVPISRSLNTQVLPEGPSSKDSFLIAPIDPECGNCALPKFLFGDKPSAVYAPPVYAVITSCLPPRGKKPIDRSSKYGDNSQKRPRLGKRIKESIIRAGTHIRNRYLARRSRKKTQRRKDSIKDANIKVLKISLEVDVKPVHADREHLPDDVPTTTVVDIPTESTFYKSTEKSLNLDGLISRNSDRQHLSRKDGHLYHLSENINLIDSDLESIKSAESAGVLNKSKKDSGPMNGNDRRHFGLQMDETTSAYNLVPTAQANIARPVDVLDQSISSREVTQPPVRLERKRDYITHPHWKHKKARKGHHFTVTYWMFYPFSRGKPICTSNLWLLGRIFKPRIRNKCYGDEVTVNDHVGDWEHISIFFEDGLPERMYISSHYFGSFYKYNHKSNTFEYVGKDTRNTLPLTATFPSVVKIKGTHPIIFSALGSHGLWGGPGKHRYLNFIKLTDETETGTPWKTWKNIDIIDYRDSYLQRPDRQWLMFHGRWGNPSYGCHKGLFGICYLSKGPTGIPQKRENFPCHKPDHPTFKPKL